MAAPNTYKRAKKMTDYPATRIGGSEISGIERNQKGGSANGETFTHESTEPMSQQNRPGL